HPATQPFGKRQRVPELPRHRLEDTHSRTCHLRADPVAGQKQDSKIHSMWSGCLYFLVRRGSARPRLACNFTSQRGDLFIAHALLPVGERREPVVQRIELLLAQRNPQIVATLPKRMASAVLA